MKERKAVKKIDELGRIVLPIDIRRELNLTAGSELQIEVSDGRIVMTLPEAMCKICGSDKDLVKLDSAYVCRSCAQKMKDILG